MDNDPYRPLLGTSRPCCSFQFGVDDDAFKEVAPLQIEGNMECEI